MPTITASDDPAGTDQQVTTAAHLPADEWQRQFDALNALIHSRADRYPPGFQADVSREAMYEGCGE